MHKILLILFFLFGIQIYSQENAFIELDTYLSDYKNFDFKKFKNHEFENLTFEVNTIEGDSVAQREIDWKITETIYALEVSYRQDNSFKYKFLALRTFAQNGDIFLIIYHNDMFDGEDSNPKYFGRDEKINSILKAHNDFYKSNLTVKEMINQISEDELYSCDENNSSEKIPSHNGYEFIKSNIDEFRNWTQSFNPELQTSGIHALEYLQKKNNVKLIEQDKKIIKHIKTRNSLLNSCSGCLIIYRKAFD